MIEKPIAWILGEYSNYADKCITWDQDIPILSDPDVLIISLSSLTAGIIKSTGKTKLISIQQKIFNRFISGGKIVYIIGKEIEYKREEKDIVKRPSKYNYYTHMAIHEDSPITNYFLSPILFDFEEVSEIILRNYDKGDRFSEYLKNIKSINLIIKGHRLNNSLIEIDPFNNIVRNVIELLKSKSDSIELIPYTMLYDKSNNTLSEKYWLKINGFWKSGELIYLPPLTNTTISDSIDKILNLLHNY